jgi:hypothetical protein
VQYDPECSDYGYTSSRCFVRICEPSFSSPDEVATTKIHEFEHVRQKQAGRWGPGNVPQPCTDDFHRLEYEAYQAEINADFGRRTSLSIDSKIMILERKIEHLQAMIDNLGIRLRGDKLKRALPGTDVETEVTLTNDAELERAVEAAFPNQAGWATFPPVASCLLAAGRDTTFSMTVAVPPEAELGMGNEVFGDAFAPDGSQASDIFFIHVIPAVDVTKGSNVSGQPGTWVEVHFTLTNESSSPSAVEAIVSSTLGWALETNHWALVLEAGEVADLQTSVMIPPGAPHVTDLLTCTAFLPADPTQTDHDWLYAETEAATTGVGGREDLALAMMPAVPNPLVGQTTLRFVLPAEGPVELGIYDVAGRRVRTLMRPGDGTVAAGVHTARWNGTDEHGARVASGVYFARLRAAERGVVRRIVVLK